MMQLLSVLGFFFFKVRELSGIFFRFELKVREMSRNFEKTVFSVAKDIGS